jgi:hypothetical protein
MRSGRGAPVRGHSPRLPGFPADKLCPFGTLLPWAFPLPGLRTPRPRPPLRRAGRVSSPGPAIDRGIPLPVPAAHELGRRFPRHLLFSGLTARCLDHSGILFPRLSRSVYLPEVRHRSRSFDRPRVDPILSTVSMDTRSISTTPGVLVLPVTAEPSGCPLPRRSAVL